LDDAITEYDEMVELKKESRHSYKKEAWLEPTSWPGPAKWNHSIWNCAPVKCWDVAGFLLLGSGPHEMPSFYRDR